MVFWIIAVQPKRILILSKINKEENFEQYFSKKAGYLQKIIADKEFLTVHEMFISELLVERFKQLKGNSKFDHVKDHFVPYEINQRGKSKSLLPVTIDRTQPERRFLNNAVIKTYNWFKSCDLIPLNVESLTKTQVKSYLCQIKEIVLLNNKELFGLFYVTKRI